jgi:hypothetical protein
MNARQLQDVIVIPVLRAVGYNSPAAVQLVLGTAAQESQMGHYITQKSGGPARGIFQMEKITYEDIWDRFIAQSVSMKAKVRLLLKYEGKPSWERMSSDLALACLMCRLKYYSIPNPLPDEGDIRGYANYWKTWYNTELGHGTVKQFEEKYMKYVSKAIA